MSQISLGGKFVAKLASLVLTNSAIANGDTALAAFGKLQGQINAMSVAYGFSAFIGTLQTITSATFTKLAFNTTTFNTAGAAFSTTLNRFTPAKAGYYKVCGYYDFGSSTGVSIVALYLYKNGISAKSLYDRRGAAGLTGAANGGTIVYLNGTTDYIELFAYLTATTTSIAAGAVFSDFSVMYMGA
jgi:hypothetical protein